MALANTIGLALRESDSPYAPHPDLWSVGAYGELVIGGGTAFESAQHPSSEVVDGTGVTLGRSFRVTGAIATGTLVPEGAGDYLVELDCADVSCGAISGNIQFTLQYAPSGGATGTFAAFSATETEGGGGRMQIIKIATTVKHSFRVRAIQRLNANSAVRVIVTSAAGDVVTITEGRLRITKIADVDPPSNP